MDKDIFPKTQFNNCIIKPPYPVHIFTVEFIISYSLFLVCVWCVYPNEIP